MVCMRVTFHENDGNHEIDKNNEDNSDSYKQGAECWSSRNHGNDENHGNPGCKPRVPQTTGFELPDIFWGVSEGISGNLTFCMLGGVFAHFIGFSSSVATVRVPQKEVQKEFDHFFCFRDSFWSLFLMFLSLFWPFFAKLLLPDSFFGRVKLAGRGVLKTKGIVWREFWRVAGRESGSPSFWKSPCPVLPFQVFLLEILFSPSLCILPQKCP